MSDFIVRRYVRTHVNGWTDILSLTLCVVCPPPEGVVGSDDLQIGTQSTGWGSGSVGLGDSSKYSNQFIGLFLNDYSYSMVHTRIVTNGYAEIFDGTAFVVVDTSVEQKKKEINKLKGSSTIGVITHKTEANMILLAFK